LKRKFPGVLISMRYGDKDGFNEIYDDNGELMLHPNEKALVIEEGVVPTLKSTWR
jgi:signal transduction histidine kinase